MSLTTKGYDHKTPIRTSREVEHVEQRNALLDDLLAALLQLASQHELIQDEVRLQHNTLF